jgi:hypothetical protein
MSISRKAAITLTLAALYAPYNRANAEVTQQSSVQYTSPDVSYISGQDYDLHKNLASARPDSTRGQIRIFLTALQNAGLEPAHQITRLETVLARYNERDLSDVLDKGRESSFGLLARIYNTSAFPTAAKRLDHALGELTNDDEGKVLVLVFAETLLEKPTTSASSLLAQPIVDVLTKWVNKMGQPASYNAIRPVEFPTGANFQFQKNR